MLTLLTMAAVTMSSQAPEPMINLVWDREGRLTKVEGVELKEISLRPQGLHIKVPEGVKKVVFVGPSEVKRGMNLDWSQGYAKLLKETSPDESGMRVFLFASGEMRLHMPPEGRQVVAKRPIVCNFKSPLKTIWIIPQEAKVLEPIKEILEKQRNAPPASY